MAHAEDVDAWLEANMPASPMISFAEAVLRHYKKLKLWWQPDVSDGWHCRTKIATAAKYYINNPDTWHQLRDDLRDKILRGGYPRTLSTTIASQSSRCLYAVTPVKPCLLPTKRNRSCNTSRKHSSISATCASAGNRWRCSHDHQSRETLEGISRMRSSARGTCSRPCARSGREFPAWLIRRRGEPTGK